MTLTAPDAGISRELARLAAAVHAQEPDRAAFRRLVDGAERALAAPVPPALAALAEEIGGPDGDLPLLGTALWADGHEALQWNAVRCGAAEVPDVALLVAGMATTGDADLASAASSGELCHAVSAGRAVAAAAEALAGDTPVRPSYGVLGVAAACALLSGVTEEEDLAAVLDLAASLMVVGAGDGDHGDVALPAAGHVCAAGRLAVLLRRAGVTPLPGAVAHTVSVVAGRPLG